MTRAETHDPRSATGRRAEAPTGAIATTGAIITRVYYGSESGMLRSEATRARVSASSARCVEIRGPIPRIDGLREGMAVGFDLGRTSRGAARHA